MRESKSKITALEALARLREGNRRFAIGEGLSERDWGVERRREVADVQEPFAIVLGCLDSRVPPEIIFDQGLGDLLVVRVAGNIASQHVMGSVELAAEAFGTQLVVVLGHSKCAAVWASYEELRKPSGRSSSELQAILDQIAPSVQSAAEAKEPMAADLWMEAAVRSNVLNSVTCLRSESRVLSECARSTGLRVVGATYDVESGLVDFFEAGAEED
jgi:carbonic anhydrase